MQEVLKALADPTRRRIVERLRERDHTAGELAAGFDLAKPTLSGHFTVLRQAGLVSMRRDGTRMTYSLNLPKLEATLMDLMDTFKLFIGPGPAPRTPLSPRAAERERAG